MYDGARAFAAILFFYMAVLYPVHGIAAAETVAIPPCSASSLTHPVDETRVSIQNTYPVLSTIVGEEGDSTVSFVVNASGKVSDVALAQSSGSARLDEAAMEGVKHLIYAPAKANGAPVACRNEMRIEWHLAPEGSEERQSREFMNFIQPPISAWPTEVLAAGKEGATGISVRIDSKGAVIQATMFKSSGIQELDAAALGYVKGVAFKPPQIGATTASAAIPVVVIWSKLPIKLPVARN